MLRVCKAFKLVVGDCNLTGVHVQCVLSLYHSMGEFSMADYSAMPGVLPAAPAAVPVFSVGSMGVTGPLTSWPGDPHAVASAPYSAPWHSSMMGQARAQV